MTPTPQEIEALARAREELTNQAREEIAESFADQSSARYAAVAGENDAVVSATLSVAAAVRAVAFALLAAVEGPDPALPATQEQDR